MAIQRTTPKAGERVIYSLNGIHHRALVMGASNGFSSRTQTAGIHVNLLYIDPALGVAVRVPAVPELTEGHLSGFLFEPPADREGFAAHLEEQLTQLRVQLTGCSVAALGYGQEAKPGDYGYSPAYADVIALRKRFEKATAPVEVCEASDQDVVTAFLSLLHDPALREYLKDQDNQRVVLDALECQPAEAPKSPSDEFVNKMMPYLLELSTTVAEIAPSMDISPYGTLSSANTLLKGMRKPVDQATTAPGGVFATGFGPGYGPDRPIDIGGCPAEQKAVFETKHYADGSSATGVAPLPDKSPDEQKAAVEADPIQGSAPSPAPTSEPQSTESAPSTENLSQATTSVTESSLLPESARSEPHESFGAHLKHDLEEIGDELGNAIGEAKFGE